MIFGIVIILYPIIEFELYYKDVTRRGFSTKISGILAAIKTALLMTKFNMGPFWTLSFFFTQTPT